MSRTIRAIIGVVLVLLITFAAISICQNLGARWKVDITEQKLYTLSDGSKNILAKLNSPIKVKLYYAKTAATKASDRIRFFNNYYEFVKSLLSEYEAQADGMIQLEIIDPRPFSVDEAQALQYGLKKFPITEDENFFFGLAIQTPFGVEKTIPFFSPDRQNFIEYDISYLIDTAITRQKKKIGVLSSLEIIGQEVSGYMAQMMAMQGQRPKPAWTIIEQLKQQYDVEKIVADANRISDVDILLVVHPKNLSEQTLFAIDQFVLGGGRAVILVDPYCYAEKPDKAQMMQMRQPPSQSSSLEPLLGSWGLEMSANTFAGDRSLAMLVQGGQNRGPKKLIGYLNLSAPQCFNSESVITAELNSVRMLFSGVLKGSMNDSQIEQLALVSTTNRGNSWSVSNPYELMVMDSEMLMKKFYDGSEPVVMAYQITGMFKSAFPDGIEIEVAVDSNDPNQPKKTKRITGLVESAEKCAVVVFADVDFISDEIAYSNFVFGKTPAGDNSSLLINTIEDMAGSGDLISIRSRGNFRRPFEVVDEIEMRAEARTAEEEAKIQARIDGYRVKLQSITASAKQGEEEIIGSKILQSRKEIERDILLAQNEWNKIKLRKRRDTERMGNILRAINMLVAPVIILVIAIVLAIRRSIKKRHYISHDSD